MAPEPEIIFPELSYKIIGAAFTVFNYLGFGLAEKDYQKALGQELDTANIKYKREVYIPSQYKSLVLSRYFADFIIEDKILLELKVAPRLGYVQAKQTLTYLQTGNLKLGILIYFTRDGVKYRRILNPKI